MISKDLASMPKDQSVIGKKRLRLHKVMATEEHPRNIYGHEAMTQGPPEYLNEKAKIIMYRLSAKMHPEMSKEPKKGCNRHYKK